MSDAASTSPNPQSAAQAAKDAAPPLFINVPVSASERARIEREEAQWDAPRFVAVLLVTLALSVALLYFLASL